MPHCQLQRSAHHLVEGPPPRVTSSVARWGQFYVRQALFLVKPRAKPQPGEATKRLGWPPLE